MMHLVLANIKALAILNFKLPQTCLITLLVWELCSVWYHQSLYRQGYLFDLVLLCLLIHL